jgi:hypothetical protein
MTIIWQWPNAVIFCVLTVVLAGLVYTGKLPGESLGVLVAWLIPSPIKSHPTTSSVQLEKTDPK